MTNRILSPNTLSILETYRDEMKQIQDNLPAFSKENLLDTPRGTQFQHIPPFIREYILQHPWKRCEKIQFSVEGIKPVFLSLHICADHDPTAEIHDFFTAFSFLIAHAYNRIAPHYEVYYYATPFKKLFPKRYREPIDEIHANSGFTAMGGGDQSVPVYIFRREESRRVWIHEMLHALNMDGSSKFSEKEGPLCSQILTPIQGQHLCHPTEGVRMYEALTETQATLLNALLPSRKHNKRSIQNALLKERDHVHQQIERIRQHYHLPVKNNYRQYKQGVSQTISYFLFRGFLMDHLDRFIYNNLLRSSNDYVEIIQEGIRKMQIEKPIKARFTTKASSGGRQSRSVKNRSLKMNYLA